MQSTWNLFQNGFFNFSLFSYWEILVLSNSSGCLRLGTLEVPIMIITKTQTWWRSSGASRLKPTGEPAHHRSSSVSETRFRKSTRWNTSLSLLPHRKMVWFLNLITVDTSEHQSVNSRFCKRKKCLKIKNLNDIVVILCAPFFTVIHGLFCAVIFCSHRAALHLLHWFSLLTDTRCPYWSRPPEPWLCPVKSPWGQTTGVSSRCSTWSETTTGRSASWNFSAVPMKRWMKSYRAMFRVANAILSLLRQASFSTRYFPNPAWVMEKHEHPVLKWTRDYFFFLIKSTAIFDSPHSLHQCSAPTCLWIIKLNWELFIVCKMLSIFKD